MSEHCGLPEITYSPDALATQLQGGTLFGGILDEVSHHRQATCMRQGPHFGVRRQSIADLDLLRIVNEAGHEAIKHLRMDEESIG